MLGFTSRMIALFALATSALAQSGIYIKNDGWAGPSTYYVLSNTPDGTGNAYGTWRDATDQDTHVTLAVGEETFIPLDEGFEGRVQRGTSKVATWIEFRLTDPSGIAWGDVSLESGYNGPATIQDAAGAGQLAGFSQRLIPLARSQMSASDFALVTVTTDTGIAFKPTGSNGEQLPTLVQWEASALQGFTKAYIAGGSGVPMARSENHQFRVTFY